jgi:hypothetical protein
LKILGDEHRTTSNEGPGVNLQNLFLRLANKMECASWASPFNLIFPERKDVPSVGKTASASCSAEESFRPSLGTLPISKIDPAVLLLYLVLQKNF